MLLLIICTVKTSRSDQDIKQLHDKIKINILENSKCEIEFRNFRNSVNSVMWRSLRNFSSLEIILIFLISVSIDTIFLYCEWRSLRNVSKLEKRLIFVISAILTQFFRNVRIFTKFFNIWLISVIIFTLRKNCVNLTEITEINLSSNIETFRKILQITEKLCQYDRNYGNQSHFQYWKIL